MENEGNSSLQAAVFDLDGTLINTDELMFRAVKEVCASYGHELGVSVFGQALGKPVAAFASSLVQAAGLGITADEFVGQAYARLRPEDIRLKPGALELLQLLQAKGIPTAIATNSSRRALAERLSAVPGVEAYFHCALSCEAILQPKPAPDIYLKATRCLDVPISSCLVIEDSEPGVAAAHSAGACIAFVPNPYVPYPEEIASRYQASLFPDLNALAAVLSS